MLLINLGFVIIFIILFKIINITERIGRKEASNKLKNKKLMICPKCQKPYFFINPEKSSFSICLNCKHEDKFIQPVYEEYHIKLYKSKSYTRTIKTDPQMKFIIKELKIIPENNVIDIGCGVGDYTKAISLLAPRVCGLDHNVEGAQKKYQGLNFIKTDCNKSLPYSNNLFDFIISINLIEHLVDYKKFLSECRRILKPDGKIALTTANLNFILHDYFFDETHVHEWTIKKFNKIFSKYFKTITMQKSSSMFKYYPLNLITTKFLKPDLLFIGKK